MPKLPILCASDVLCLVLFVDVLHKLSDQRHMSLQSFCMKVNRAKLDTLTSELKRAGKLEPPENPSHCRQEGEMVNLYFPAAKRFQHSSFAAKNFAANLKMEMKLKMKWK